MTFALQGFGKKETDSLLVINNQGAYQTGHFSSSL
jgi:hypothetical protein